MANLRKPSVVMLIAVVVGSGAIASTRELRQPDHAASAIPAGVPDVFRCIFEDQPRMVIVRPTQDLWVAFNPGSCTIDKIWRGGMKFRGKVWDFSQDSCAASDDAVVWARRNRVLAELSDRGSADDGWTIEAAEPLPGGGWQLLRDGATVTSPEFRACGGMIGFDETGRGAPLRIDVSTDGGSTWTAQSFLSTMHGTSDTDWQFNFRALEACSEHVRIRWTALQASGKSLRRVRVTDDQTTTTRISGERREAPPRWRGYERDAAKPGTVVLLYDVGEPPIHVRHRIHAETGERGARLIETLTLVDAPAQTDPRVLPPRPGLLNGVTSVVAPDAAAGLEVGSSGPPQVVLKSETRSATRTITIFTEQSIEARR